MVLINYSQVIGHHDEPPTAIGAFFLPGAAQLRLPPQPGVVLCQQVSAPGLRAHCE
jgi:hypothetical protein